MRLNCIYGLIGISLCNKTAYTSNVKTVQAYISIYHIHYILRSMIRSMVLIAFDCSDESPIRLLHNVYKVLHSEHAKQTSSPNSLRIKIIIEIPSALLLLLSHRCLCLQRSITRPTPFSKPHNTLPRPFPVRYLCHDRAPLLRKREHRRHGWNAYIIDDPRLRVRMNIFS